jgi:hypothetical protein
MRFGKNSFVFGATSYGKGKQIRCSPFCPDAAELHPAVIPEPTTLFCHSRHCLTVGANFVLASF